MKPKSNDLDLKIKEKSLFANQKKNTHSNLGENLKILISKL